MHRMRNERIMTLQSAPHGARRRLARMDRRLARMEKQLDRIERQMGRIEHRMQLAQRHRNQIEAPEGEAPAR